MSSTSKSTKQKQSNIKTSTRDFALDFLRGCAVLFMIITHVGGLFYFKKGTLLDGLIWWGATGSFVIFLFVFGATAGLSLGLKGFVDFKKAFGRGLYFLAIYYLLGIFLTFIQFDRLNLNEILIKFSDIMLFRFIPEFVEFILAFALFSFLTGVFGYFIKISLKKPLRLLIISWIIYATSRYLYTLNVDGFLMNLVKSLFVGNEQTHTFGILSYFPIWSMGLLWGYCSIKANDQFKAVLASFFMRLGIVFLIIFNITGFSTWNRWPPSLIFLLYGLTFCAFVLRFYKIISKVRPVDKYIIHLGQNAFPYYYFHLIILFVFGILIKWPQLSAIYTLLLTMGILVFTYIAVRVESLVRMNKK